VSSTSSGRGVSRVVALPVGEKTVGVDTVEGMVIRVGEEFGLRTQTLVTVAIYDLPSYNMFDNAEGRVVYSPKSAQNSHVIKLTPVGVGMPLHPVQFPQCVIERGHRDAQKRPPIVDVSRNKGP